MGKWIILLVAGTLLLAALAAPAAHLLLQAAAPGAGWPLARVFDRLAVVTALVLIILMRRRLQLDHLALAWQAESRFRRGRDLAIGFGLAVGPALVAVPLVVASTPVGWAGRGVGMAAWELVAAVPGALLVAALEESFFRVLVFRGLTRTWPVGVAALASSVLYGVVHFLTPDRQFVAVSGSPVEGLRYLAVVFGKLLGVPFLLAVGGLTLIGIVLCFTLWRTHSVVLCVGLHAGWFAATKVAIYLSTLEPGAPAAGSLGKRLLLLGSPWVWLAVVVTGALLVLVTARSMERSHPSLAS